MSSNDDGPQRPSRADLLRPVEVLVLSAAMSLFVGGVVFLSTRAWLIALIAVGVAFIVTLVVFATLALLVKPDPDERAKLEERRRRNDQAEHGDYR